MYCLPLRYYYEQNKSINEKELRPPKASAPFFVTTILFSAPPTQAGPVLAQQTFCFSAKGILEHDSHNQCAKHWSHRFQPGIHNPKPFSPTNKRNANKQHKQQNNDDNTGSAVAFTSFDFGPYLSKRTGADLPDVSGRALLVLCDGFGELSVDDGAKQDLPLQLGQLM